MKRFLMMALVAVFVLGTFGTAMAETEFSGKGSMQFLFNWSDNTDFFDDDGNEDDFLVAQRTRLFLNAAASENVKATIGFEIDTDWGFDNGADLGGDEVNVETKRAMITFKYPGTDLAFIMGLQGFALPGAVAGSPVLDEDLAALAMAYQFNDMVSMTAFWARLSDVTTYGNTGDGTDATDEDETDALGLILPIAFDGATLTPWFMYAMTGEDSEAIAVNGDAFWLGAALEVSAFDPFVILADLMYGSLDIDDTDADQQGWFFDLAVAYKMDMVTPMVAFVYSSGDDSSDNDAGVMPTVSAGWGLTNLGTSGGYAINRGTDGILGSFDDDLGLNQAAYNRGIGVWALGLILADFSFIEDVSHTAAFVYYEGTSDDDAGYSFDEDDSAWELNLDTKYQLYESLAAYIELGYVAVDHDDFTNTDDAWKLAIGLTYKF